ncbi:glycosyltransferase [Loktanella sp. TSTF-M6]|uniref:Glycosyltransferase n=1 Tax=Loktanella gaetbuli TaxID=2881335 RepID=A0ABS8BY70_9RHOB|nr:glycosyltransferase family 2 protein [Loktanella gaetbuli]MCB5200670.1 glycosyltransferase [Loktanella gaetbuli]
MEKNNPTVQPLLSVIIPFYNEVAFLPTTIKSIITQDIDGIEVIIVNDNPAQFTSDFFDSLALPDFVRVIHPPQNNGLPGARNIGLDAVRGQYLAFLDADDFYTHQGLRRQLDYAIETGADMTHGQTIQTKLNNVRGAILPQERAFFGPESRGIFYGDSVPHAGFNAKFCWSFIFRTAFINDNNLRFDVTQRQFEDRIFVVDALKSANSLAILGEPTKIWRRRANSITTTAPDFEKWRMWVTSFEKSIDRWEALDSPHSRELVLKELFCIIFDAIRRSGASLLRGEAERITPGDRTHLRDRYLGIVKKVSPTESEIRRHFTVGHLHFTKGQSGRGKISQDDAVALYRALQDADMSAFSTVLDRVFASATSTVPMSGSIPTRGNRKVIVHFGMPKTASTTIQTQLDKNRDHLITQGVLFPATGLGTLTDEIPTRAEGLPGHDKLRALIAQGDLSLVHQIAAEADALGCHTIIISAENISMPDANQARRKAAIGTFVAALAPLGDIVPVLFYRRPDRWMESYYRELVSTGGNTGNMTPAEYLLNNERQLDFGNLVNTIETACAKELRLTSLEDATAHGRSPVHAFLELCDLGALAEGLAQTDQRHYPSIDTQQLKLAELVNLLVPNVLDRQNILRDFYRLAPGTRDASSVFSAKERVQIVTLFCDSLGNANLEKRLNLPKGRWIQEAAAPTPETPGTIPTDLLDQLVTAAYLNGVEGGEPSRLRQEIATLRRTVKDLQRKNERLHANHRKVMRSKSMRLTEPMRWVAQLFH